jgi:CBS domain-containing protein
MDAHSLHAALASADTLDALGLAARRIDALVEQLQVQGTRVETMAAQVTALNTRLFERTWQMLAPAELVSASCLLVMGSEGRGEQLLKTDQDNGLLLRDARDAGALERLAAEVAPRFAEALAGFGYPPCPGHIMLTNPLWRQPLAAFREQIRQWLFGPDPEGPMRLAIFFDAAAVAGDGGLLDEAREHLESIASSQDLVLARFAAAADQFQEPAHWWARLRGRLDEEPLDLKKLGTFPVVHGVRALALQQRVRERGTGQRLRALIAGGRVDAELAADTLRALHALMQLRLAHQLRQRRRGEAPGNTLRPAELPDDERQALRDALAIVKRWRVFLRQHFRLDAL